eukprot:7000295-Alexandrium_andersonii.AAC.1
MGRLGGAQGALDSRPGKGRFRAFGAFGPQARSGRVQASASLGNPSGAKSEQTQRVEHVVHRPLRMH